MISELEFSYPWHPVGAFFRLQEPALSTYYVITCILYPQAVHVQLPFSYRECDLREAITIIEIVTLSI